MNATTHATTRLIPPILSTFYTGARRKAATHSCSSLPAAERPWPPSSQRWSAPAFFLLAQELPLASFVSVAQTPPIHRASRRCPPCCVRPSPTAPPSPVPTPDLARIHRTAHQPSLSGCSGSGDRRAPTRPCSESRAFLAGQRLHQQHRLSGGSLYRIPDPPSCLHDTTRRRAPHLGLHSSVVERGTPGSVKLGSLLQPLDPAPPSMEASHGAHPHKIPSLHGWPWPLSPHWTPAVPFPWRTSRSVGLSVQ
ncbi:uncharacterized protein LOC119338776 [Triticum dicoccoides]|uniref:uncharacterized protein LOC119338776 n=1 Tax=Triticum dicoccoides TaxID=85692 RepID=UPI001890FD16|nr:uncharacterized protein LOC119338776 [Triticum dicoccoides]